MNGSRVAAPIFASFTKALLLLLIRLVPILARGLLEILGPLLTLIYFSIFVMIVASETYVGVLLGAKCHSQSEE